MVYEKNGIYYINISMESIRKVCNEVRLMVMERPDLKPCCSLINAFFSMKLILETINFSKSFGIEESKEISL